MDMSGLTSYYADYASTSSSDSKLAALQEKANSNLSGSSDEELMDVCKEFESYFLEQMYTAMLDTIPKDEEEEDTYGSKMVDCFKDTAIQSLAEQSTEQGGFGLAQTLYEQLKRQYSV